MRPARALAAIAVGLTLAVFVACSLPGGDYTTADDDAGGANQADGVAPGQTNDGGPGGDVNDADPDGPLPGTVDAAPAEGCPSAGHTCQPDAPDGWTGPLFVYDGDEDGLPSCPDTMAVSRINAHRGFHDPGAFTCSDCTCGGALGGTCNTSLNVYGSDCSQTPTSTTPLGLLACGPIPSGSSYTITATPTGQKCTPFGGIPQGNNVQWDSATRACGAPSLLRTGCADGQVCAPVAQNPFRSKLCVSKTGDVDCPGAPYTEKLLTNGVDDERKCGPKCDCNPPTGGTCSGMGQGYPSSQNCSGVPQTLSVPLTTCTVASGPYSVRATFANPAGGSCTPVTQTPTPSGSATAASPVTICCQN